MFLALALFGWSVCIVKLFKSTSQSIYQSILESTSEDNRVTLSIMWSEGCAFYESFNKLQNKYCLYEMNGILTPSMSTVKGGHSFSHCVLFEVLTSIQLVLHSNSYPSTLVNCQSKQSIAALLQLIAAFVPVVPVLVSFECCMCNCCSLQILLIVAFARNELLSKDLKSNLYMNLALALYTWYWNLALSGSIIDIFIYTIDFPVYLTSYSCCPVLKDIRYAL